MAKVEVTLFRVRHPLGKGKYPSFFSISGKSGRKRTTRFPPELHLLKFFFPKNSASLPFFPLITRTSPCQYAVTSFPLLFRRPSIRSIELGLLPLFSLLTPPSPGLPSYVARVPSFPPLLPPALYLLGSSHLRLLPPYWYGEILSLYFT